MKTKTPASAELRKGNLDSHKPAWLIVVREVCRSFILTNLLNHRDALALAVLKLFVLMAISNLVR